MNNDNHKLNCVKNCLNGHEGSEITSLDFQEPFLISGSKNGQIVLWNLFKNSVIRCQHHITSEIKFIEFVSPNCFLVFTLDFKMFVYLKQFLLKTDPLYKPGKVFRFNCIHIISFGVSGSVDSLCAIHRHKKEIWLGTSVGQLFYINLKLVFLKFNINERDINEECRFFFKIRIFI